MKQKQKRTKVYICPECKSRFDIQGLISGKLPPHQIEESHIFKLCPKSGQSPNQKWE
ncbi:MAG: hypothetical protein PHS49_03095 [Candidatus Gracilibacteria bacterium]|nr:hypothetical protein [Candidatus Gracilibacteria bacterium]